MKSLWLENEITYDGSQLSPLYNYLNYSILGDSVVSWQGPCDVSLEHMIDGEDLLAKSTIAGSNMVHFVLELFDQPLKAAILLQRLMGEMAKTTLIELSPEKEKALLLKRKGDDLYLSVQKFNISIATISNNSSLIHFAVNISNAGTPVETCSLEDFNVEAKTFASYMMDKITTEVSGQIRASQKVRLL